MKHKEFREFCGVCDQLGVVINIKRVARTKQDKPIKDKDGNIIGTKQVLVSQYNLMINGEVKAPERGGGISYETRNAAKRRAIREAIPTLQLTPKRVLKKLSKTDFTQLWKTKKQPLLKY